MLIDSAVAVAAAVVLLVVADVDPQSGTKLIRHAHVDPRRWVSAEMRARQMMGDRMQTRIGRKVDPSSPGPECRPRYVDGQDSGRRWRLPRRGDVGGGMAEAEKEGVVETAGKWQGFRPPPYSEQCQWNRSVGEKR